MANVFISHAGEDTATASEVRAWLREDGHQVFLDRDLDDGIAIGDDWAARLHERLRWADAVVCLLTPAYVASSWCTAEVAIATSRGSRVLPLAVDGVSRHPLMGGLQTFPFAPDPLRARRAVATLLREVDGAGGGGWSDDRSPFPGLRPFGRDGHRAFFGREPDVRALLDGLRSDGQAASSVTLVVGPSGCGKSSLVMAGLVPAVARDPRWWTVEPCAPGRDPVSNLVRVLAAAGGNLGLTWSASEVRTRLEAGRLQDIATDLLVAAPGSHRRRLLVVIDQFEELVTQTAPDERGRFTELVLRRAEGGSVQVLGTMRPEFLDVLQADPVFANLSTAVELILPLSREALRNVVEKPAELAGIAIEDGLVTRLVDDTGSGDALPLLAYTMAELARGVGRGGRLLHAHYDQLGGVRGALVAQADAALADAVARHGRTDQLVIRDLLRLVTVDAQGRATRWQVPIRSLPTDVGDELGAFVDRRILVTGEEGEHPTIGVAHEAVLTTWTPLADAIEDSRAALRARHGVDQGAQEWAREGNPPSRLWERGQLATALHDLGVRRGTPLHSDRVELSEDAVGFLRSSIRRDRFRQARLNLVLGSLLVVALVGGVLAWVQGRVADDQRSLAVVRQLVAQADAARGTDDRTALQLGIAAQRLRPDSATAASLVETLSTTRYVHTVAMGSAVASAAYRRDGGLLAIGTVAGPVRLWDTTDPTRPTAVGEPLDAQIGFAYSVEFSPDGRTLAVAGGAGKAVLWDVSRATAPRRLSDLNGHGAAVHAATFSPDGRTLATAGFDRLVILWDVSDPARPRRIGAPLAGGTDRLTTVAFSPDGRTLAGAGFDDQVRLWDVTDPARAGLLGTAPGGPVNTVWSVAWSPGGHTLGAASADGTVTLWDAADPAAPHRIGEPIPTGPGQVYSLAFAPDGTRLATAGTNRVVSLWDLTDPLRPLRTDALAGHSGYIPVVAFHDEDTLVSGSSDGTAIVWDAAEPFTSDTVGAGRDGPDIDVYAIATTADGRLLATGNADGTIGIVDIGDRTARRLLSRTAGGGSGAVRAVATTPDGRTLAAAGEDGVVRLWDIADPSRPRPIGEAGLPAAGRRIYSLAVTPDGRTLAAAGDDRVVALWNISDPARPQLRGNPLTGHTGPVYSVRFGGTGLLAAGSTDSTVILWDVSDPDRARRLGAPLTGHAAAVDAISFNPDGTLMATGGGDGSVLLWDSRDPAHTRLAVRQPAGDGAAVLTTAFAPDGRTLAAGDAGGRLLLWDLTDPSSPRPLRTPTRATTAVNAVAFTADSGSLLSAARERTLDAWDLGPVDEIRARAVDRACAIVGSGLDPDQWATYLPDEPYTPTCSGP